MIHVRKYSFLLLTCMAAAGCGDDSDTSPDGGNPPDAMPAADASDEAPDAAPADAGADAAEPPDAAVNLAPTDLELTNATILEHSAAGTVIGRLQASDPNPSDVHRYELLDDAGGRFALAGSQLVLADAALIDFESLPAHDIVVRVADAGGLSFDKVLTVQVGDLTEVCSTADAGPGSLRQAIADAAPGSTVYLEDCGTITLTSAIAINKRVTLRGPGADTLVLSGGHATRLFESADVSARLTLEDLTIADGSSNADGGCIRSKGRLTLRRVVVRDCAAARQGGAVDNGSEPLVVSDSQIHDNSAGSRGGAVSSAGTVTIQGSMLLDNTSQADGGALYLLNSATIKKSTLRGNEAQNGSGGAIASLSGTTILDTLISENHALYYGGGITTTGLSFSIKNSTISGNHATYGGGIAMSGRTLTLHHVTVASNRATRSGGGIELGSGTVGLANTILAGNTVADRGVDMHVATGMLRSDGFNLVQSPEGHTLIDGQDGNQIGVDPRLKPLADNGGGSQTHALDPGSPAINAIPLERCRASADQRGLSRPAGSACDIGAYEHQ